MKVSFDETPDVRRVPWTAMLTSFGKSGHKTLRLSFPDIEDAKNKARAARYCVERKKLPMTVTRRGRDVWIVKESAWTG